jgi:hypothetical protein
MTETATSETTATPSPDLRFTLSLSVGATVRDYRDIAAVLRELADEFDEPERGREGKTAWRIELAQKGTIYKDVLRVRDNEAIGGWQIMAE